MLNFDRKPALGVNILSDYIKVWRLPFLCPISTVAFGPPI
jgi:hypothetical protein